MAETPTWEFTFHHRNDSARSFIQNWPTAHPTSDLTISPETAPTTGINLENFQCRTIDKSHRPDSVLIENDSLDMLQRSLLCRKSQCSNFLLRLVIEAERYRRNSNAFRKLQSYDSDIVGGVRFLRLVVSMKAYGFVRPFWQVLKLDLVLDLSALAI
jgi:hypothetical protein